jgi:protoporphyrinogen oxidase
MQKKFDFTIIGAGPMGIYLSCLLVKKGFKIRLLDRAQSAGGHTRAVNFYNIHTEIFYHFFYKNDHFNFEKWCNLVNFKSKIIWKSIKTEIFTKKNNKIKKINPDSFFDLFLFFKFSIFKIILSFLKIKIIAYKKLSSLTAINWAYNAFGKKFSSLVWIPLLKGKFGKEYKQISSLWLYTRIKRHLSTKNIYDNKSYFGYLVGTYNPLINKSILFLKKQNSKFESNIEIKKFIFKKKKISQIVLSSKKLIISKNEKVISTIPLFALKNILPKNRPFTLAKVPLVLYC